MMRFLSTIHDFFHEKCHVSRKNGFSFFERKKCQRIDTLSAPIITSKSVGSQLPKISKNHCTRTGDVISERESQNQNNIPAVSIIKGEIWWCFINYKI